MIQQTVLEQQRAEHWHRRYQERVMAPRRLLKESDVLLNWLEECLVQNLRFVPGWVMPRLVNLLSEADPLLPRQLGSERRPEHLMELVYRAQQRLMEDSVRARKPAPIIPLFGRNGRRRSARQASSAGAGGEVARGGAR
jgi:hypothetical protein